MLLAGDIGGTKTNLALFDEREEKATFTHFSSFHSQSFPNLRDIIQHYFQTEAVRGLPPISAACFAIAGPVKNGVCRATNLPWVVDAQDIVRACKIPNVHLINDLEANAYAIEVLEPSHVITLFNPKDAIKGNRAVISPGTGLGEAGLFWDGRKHHPFACEGGHTDFGPRDSLQLELCHYLIQRFGHASYERVLSGPGLHNIYSFFVEAKKCKEPSWLIEEMQNKDPAAVISEHALNGKSELCAEALTLFTSIYGAEVGNCALKFMAFGGIYLGGGIPPKILPKLREPLFLQAFLDKGRMADLLKTMPIHVILDEKASLRGAAHYIRLIDDSVIRSGK